MDRVHAAVVTYTMDLPPLNSLKEKRSIVKSIVEKARRRFNISMCESGMNDLLSSCQLSAAFVATNRAGVESIQCRITRFLDSQPEVDIVEVASDPVRQ